MLLLKKLQWLLIIYRIEPRLFCMTQETLLHLFSTNFSAFLLPFSFTNSMLSPKTSHSLWMSFPLPWNCCPYGHNSLLPEGLLSSFKTQLKDLHFWEAFSGPYPSSLSHLSISYMSLSLPLCHFLIIISDIFCFPYLQNTARAGVVSFKLLYFCCFFQCAGEIIDCCWMMEMNEWMNRQMKDSPPCRSYLASPVVNHSRSGADALPQQLLNSEISCLDKVCVYSFSQYLFFSLSFLFF